jgi:hypothetical protein
MTVAPAGASSAGSVLVTSLSTLAPADGATDAGLGSGVGEAGTLNAGPPHAATSTVSIGIAIRVRISFITAIPSSWPAREVA